ncbi:MAG: hypothetical protein KDB61_04960, partial [Planctomycetes bacterium]|nr:hypothetical protein [Planctomycetota bacterium]
MNQLPLILACLACGAVGSVAGTLLLSPNDSPSGTSDSEVTELRAELAQVRSAARADREKFEERLARMEEEASLVSPTLTRTSVPQHTANNISDDNVPVLASNADIRIGNSVIPPEQFEAWVQRASESIEERKQQERDQERLIREGERIEEQVAKLTTDLGLDQRQQPEFRRYL